MFLGHDLPLAQVSVSRLLETPEDIAGQFTQYLAAERQARHSQRAHDR